MAQYSETFLRGQKRWQESQFNRLRGLRSVVEQSHQKQWRGGDLLGANAGLRGVVDKLRNRGIGFHHGVTFDFGLSFDASDDEIKEFSESKARQCERLLHRSPWPALEVAGVLARCRIDDKFMYDKRRGRSLNWEARVCCESWWRRKMRVICARASEQVSREQGLTHRRAGCYVSEFTFRRWLSQQNRNRLLLEEMEAINSNGEAFTLQELSDKSTSNPELRRGELMTRLRGFEEWADRDSGGWVAVFYTVTCPSKYHVYSGSRKNEKYGGFTPRAGAEYLSGLWSRVRAKLARKDFQIFGFRIAEPHHDGCPHWHLLLFMSSDSQPDITAIFRAYALEEDGEERGAEKHRFTVEIIDRSRGSAAGYISKYISKNVDGFGVGPDLEAQDFSEITALRVRAWASTWGIRQFQQIGGPPVTVYRELRRAVNTEEIRKTPQLEMILNPADAGDWAGFVDAMGGAVCPRKDRPARIEYCEKGPEEQEKKRGRYGEFVRKILGVIGADFLVVSRRMVWVVRRKHSVVSQVVAGFRDIEREIVASLAAVRSALLPVAVGVPVMSFFEFLKAGGSPPWTCVNNCTGVVLNE